MDQENFEYLKDKLKYSGFEDKLNTALENQIKSGAVKFTLPFQMEIEDKKVDYNLHFKKSEVSERYFYNKMDVSVQNSNPEIEGKSHSFYQNQGVTAKEAFNLLEGRAVNKTMQNTDKEQYKAWLQLDLSQKGNNGNFKVNQYHEKYGFDLEAKLREFPIKELGDQTKTEWMMKSLRKGNQYPITMEKNGMDEIMFIEASPKFKSINVFDVSFSSVKAEDLKLDNGKDKSVGQEPIVEELGKKKVMKEGVSAKTTEKKESAVQEVSKKTKVPSVAGGVPQTAKVPRTGKGKRI